MSLHHGTRRILRNSKKIFSDAVQLAHQFLIHRPDNLELSRQVLRRNVEHNNSIAYTLLRLDREIVFMRYKGMGIYIRDEVKDYTVAKKQLSWLFTDQVSGTQKNTATSTDEINPNCNLQEKGVTKVAKVSFMITAQQKHILREMAYSDRDIKRLKPLEARLIIDNDISCHEKNWKQKVLELVNKESLNQYDGIHGTNGDNNANEDVELRDEKSKSGLKLDKAVNITLEKESKQNQLLIECDRRYQTQKK